MEIRDLTHDERLALVALIEIVVEADRNVSEEEILELGLVGSELGAEEYDRLADLANERFPDEDALKAFLPSITRQEARELIYGQVLDAAVEDGVDVLESELLDWLAKAWNVRVEIIDEPGGD